MSESDGAITFSDFFLSDELLTSFGVFTFNGTTAAYRMLPLTECDKYGQGDAAFFRDVQIAKQRVALGEGIAIVIASIVEDDTFTQLTFIPCQRPPSRVRERRCNRAQ